VTPEEARERLQRGGPADRRVTLRALAEEADARVTPAIAALLHDDDPELVALAEATLWRVWSRSGDPAVDALLAEGVRTMEAQDWLGAVARFSQVVEALPTFAEGWNKRATARYLATHYASSIADCEVVVRLNPHHFGALSGQGLCHAALGQLRPAAHCFRRALAIHPRLETVRQHLARMEMTLVRANGHQRSPTNSNLSTPFMTKCLATMASPSVAVTRENILLGRSIRLRQPLTPRSSC